MGRKEKKIMRREFNVTGLCILEKHYMVNLSGRLEQMKRMVDKGNYFVINRADNMGRQRCL